MIAVKKIVLSLCLILLGASVLSGCTKDEFLDQYNNIVQSAGSIALTGNSSLQGTKEKGIDDYTGSYTANYEDFSDTEYLFGGTSIKREAGKDLSIDCALEVTDGTAKVFWISGADEEVTLLETTGTYSDTITLPEGGNYIGIECENFTGSIELNIQRWRYLDYWIDGWIIGTDSGSVFSWRYTDRVGSSDDLFGLYAADLDFWADPRGISGRFHSGVFPWI